MPAPREARLSALKAEIAALEAGTRTPSAVLPFGDVRVDGCLPGGGLALGRWHEVVGEPEEAAAPAAFAALLARLLTKRGEVVWVLGRDDLWAPGLAGLGLPASRLIQVHAESEAQALAALEDALGSAGVACAIGEVEAVGLTAGRRLQLACERHGATGLVVRRRPFGGRARRESGSAAASRWQVTPAPGEALGGLGLGAPRWRVELQRCRGGRTGGWMMDYDEAGHDAHPLRVVADLGDRDVQAQEFRLSA